MMEVRVAQAAAADIELLLAHSGEEFGYEARQRYERLIETALMLLGERASSVSAEDALPGGFHAFHLILARRKARALGPTVGRPRHFLVWRLHGPDVIEVARVLHEAMDLPRHLGASESVPD
jgi:toxin ParE1/3/4